MKERAGRTRFTVCGACTTAAALDAGSKFRLLAAVGRTPDVVRGPGALSEERRIFWERR